MKKIFWLLTTSLLFLAYHNCAPIDVNLEDALAAAALKPSYLSGEGEICLPIGYSLHSFYITNFNAVFKDGILQPDSDGDGLSDNSEPALGYDMLNRRSRGPVLDRACLGSSNGGDCTDLKLNCQGIINRLGLSDCDVEFLGLDRHFDHPDQGVDSDKDGVIDLIELIRGGFPVVPDMADDPDRDFVINQDEYARGSEVRIHDEDMAEKYSIKFDLKLQSPGAACDGESWGINVSQIPLLIVEEFKAQKESALDGAVHFSHEKDENVILFYYTIKNADGKSSSQIWINHFKIKRSDPKVGQTRQWGSDEFVKVGEIQP